MQRVVVHSTLKVLFFLISSLMKSKNEEYEFILYDLNFPENAGSNPLYVEEFKKLGIEYIDLHSKIFVNNSPIYSLVEKCIKTREILIEDNIDIFLWLHSRVDYMCFYKTRTAPKQIYWYHSSNLSYDIEGIDQRVSHGGVASETNYIFKKFDIDISDKEYNKQIDKSIIKEYRDLYPSDVFILGSIGRLIKIDNDEYLDTVITIMNTNSKTIYLACGGGEQEKIKEKIKKSGLLDRFYFTGHIDSHIYGNIIDLYLDPFPYGGGEALQEYRYKGKAYVSMHTDNWQKEKDKIDFNLVYNENKTSFINKSLYTRIDYENVNKLGYLVEENKNAKFFVNICNVINQKDYVNVTNRLLIDKELKNKIVEERKFIVMNNKLNSDSFWNILDD
jgi:glycosyltransferase involved in cell wall biosynthesis